MKNYVFQSISRGQFMLSCAHLSQYLQYAGKLYNCIKMQKLIQFPIIFLRSAKNFFAVEILGIGKV